MTAKERPILFNAPMVQAILDGRKTMTRRVIKNNPKGIRTINLVYPGWTGIEDEHGRPIKIPYSPDDRLWVRETWAAFDNQAIKDRDRSKVFYRADDQTNYSSDGKWKPSIFMPRWASRILLEVTDVKIERLQDISEEDAVVEGAEPFFSTSLADFAAGKPVNPTHRNGFMSLWDEINGPGAWDANPWVWVISFKRIES